MLIDLSHLQTGNTISSFISGIKSTSKSVTLSNISEVTFMGNSVWLLEFFIIIGQSEMEV